jgi:hypothetical protein
MMTDQFYTKSSCHDIGTGLRVKGMMLMVIFHLLSPLCRSLFRISLFIRSHNDGHSDTDVNDSYMETSLITDDKRERMKIHLACLVPK